MCPDGLRKLFRCLDGHLLISNDQQLWHVRWATNLTVGTPLTSPESIFGLKHIFVSIIRYPDQVRGHTVKSRWWGSEPPAQILLSSRSFCSAMPTTVRQCLSGHILKCCWVSDLHRWSLIANQHLGKHQMHPGSTWCVFGHSHASLACVMSIYALFGAKI